MNYKEMYYCLFNAVTDAVRNMQACNYGLALDLLKIAQSDAEKLYMQDASENEQEARPQGLDKLAEEGYNKQEKGAAASG